LGKRLDLWNIEDLKMALDFHNVGWTGAHTPWFIEVFDQNPDVFKPLGEVRGFKFYKVLRNHSFFIEGTGECRADYNKIMLTNIKTDTNRVVISYHWHPSLKTDPPAKVVRVMIGDDPVGYVGIENPAKNTLVQIDFW